MRWQQLAMAMVLATLMLGASCGQVGLALMPGVVNDPGNRSLRRAVFAFALDSLCREMQNRSVPLKMRNEDPGTGRFYATACSAKQLESENLFVQFIGHGYAWSNVTARVGFEASAAIEYDHDFLLEGSTMYVYFRQRTLSAHAFKTLMVEKAQRGPVSLLGPTFQVAAEQVGKRVLEEQLARGFTVVRRSDGSVSFALGVLEKGERPLEPFERGDSRDVLVANDRSELHQGQRDFLGPFAVSSGDVLTVTAALEGAPAVDVLVVVKSAGDQWLSAYERQAVPTPPVATMVDDVLAAPAVPLGGAVAPWRRSWPLPRGLYYVVLDHTAAAGRTMPTRRRFDDRAALVSYAVQVGDGP